MKVMWHTTISQRTRVVTVALICVIVWGVFSIAAPAHAEFSLLSVVSEPCRDCGACSICDLMWVVTKTMRFVLSLAGALALALFIWGGWEMMLSGGKAEEVEHGKKVISGTVVGLVIILLLAWVWPNWVILALKGVPEGGKPQTIFSGDAWWFTPCQQKQALVDPKVCSPVEGGEIPEGEGLCTEINSAGVRVPKPVGSGCESTEQKGGETYLCDKEGDCSLSCATDDECWEGEARFKKPGNYCDKQVTGQQGAGVCSVLKPGDQCPQGRGCPKYRFEYYHPKMECIANQTCRISEGELCQVSDQCIPGTTCVEVLNYPLQKRCKK